MGGCVLSTLPILIIRNKNRLETLYIKVCGGFLFCLFADESAINAAQIQVMFSKAVDEATAENAANYVLRKTDNSTINITGAEVQEDGKTVLLTVTPITSKTTLTATVKNVKLEGSLTETFPLFTQVLTVEDVTSADVTSVVSKTNGDTASSLTVNFSEPVTAGAIKVNGTTKAYTLAADGLSATITGLSLDASKSHTLEVVNLTDTASNVNTLVSKTFNVTKDTAAPTFTVSTSSDNKIVLSFDKAVDANTITTGNIVLKDEKLDTVGGYSVDVPAGYGSKRVEITLPAGTYSTKDTRTFTILASDSVKDSLGNKLASTTKTVSISVDETKPALTGIEYVKNSDGEVTYVLFKYSEKVLETANLGLTAKNITTGASVDLFGTLTAADVEVLSNGTTVKVEVKGATAIKSGKLEVNVPASFVTDTALTANNSVAVKQVVDFGTGATGELKVSTVTNPARNQFKVTFNDVVTYASASNPANYSINGVALPADSTIVFDTTNKDNVVITLPAGFIAADDTGAVLRVQNVETATGVKVSSNTTVVTVDDNVGPSIAKAKSAINSNGTFSLGFSEAVATVATVGEANVLADLVLKINGIELTAAAEANVDVADGAGSDAGKYVLTFNTVTDTTAETVAGSDATVTEYFDVDGDGTFNGNDVLVKKSTGLTDAQVAAYAVGTLDLNKVSGFIVGTAATTSKIVDTNAPVANVILDSQSVEIK
jgi:hypothetical protein